MWSCNKERSRSGRRQNYKMKIVNWSGITMEMGFFSKSSTMLKKLPLLASKVYVEKIICNNHTVEDLFLGVSFYIESFELAHEPKKAKTTHCWQLSLPSPRHLQGRDLISFLLTVITSVAETNWSRSK